MENGNQTRELKLCESCGRHFTRPTGAKHIKFCGSCQGKPTNIAERDWKRVQELKKVEKHLQ